MVSLLFALSMLFSPAHHVSAQPVRHEVQDFAPQTVNTGTPNQATPDASLPTADQDLTVEEAGLVALINSDRATQGLDPLVIDPRLTEIAREHSRDMSDRRYFDHIAPGPGPASPMDRYLAYIGHRPAYAMVGENIYYRSVTDEPDQTQNQAETAFMNSAGHRANILQPRFTKVGVGFYRGDNGQFWVTEMFLRDNQ